MALIECDFCGDPIESMDSLWIVGDRAIHQECADMKEFILDFDPEFLQMNKKEE